MKEELRTTKYAAELNILDLGADVILKYIKKYKYRGEQREKVVPMYRPNHINHSVVLPAGSAYVSVRHAKKPTHTYSSDWEYLPLDATIAIYDLVKE